MIIEWHDLYNCGQKTFDEEKCIERNLSLNFYHVKRCHIWDKIQTPNLYCKFLCPHDNIGIEINFTNHHSKYNQKVFVKNYNFATHLLNSSLQITLLGGENKCF